ncbi:MAG: hypothetical protein ACREGB_02815, partial [Candidatus Saccharimonadales bacterium]
MIDLSDGSLSSRGKRLFTLFFLKERLVINLSDYIEIGEFQTVVAVLPPLRAFGDSDHELPQ